MGKDRTHKSSFSGVVQPRVDPSSEWTEFACCAKAGAVILQRGEKRFLMLSATDETGQERCVSVQGVLRCPFCESYASFAETPVLGPVVTPGIRAQMDHLDRLCLQEEEVELQETAEASKEEAPTSEVGEK